MKRVLRSIKTGREGEGSPFLAFILCLIIVLIPVLIHGHVQFNAALPERLPKVPLPDSPYQSGLKPAKGRFLVASERLNKSFFSRTVILLVDYSPLGATGLIINKPTKAGLSQLIPELENTRISGDIIYGGGPVGLNNLMMLIRAEKKPVDSVPVFQDIYFSGSMSTLKGLVEDGKGSMRFRAYAGYAGWSPGQLESEILRGSWYVMEGEANMVFDESPSEIWPELMRRKELKLEHVEIEQKISWQCEDKRAHQ
jgi:putative transcriptional regulator